MDYLRRLKSTTYSVTKKSSLNALSCQLKQVTRKIKGCTWGSNLTSFFNFENFSEKDSLNEFANFDLSANCQSTCIRLFRSFYLAAENSCRLRDQFSSTICC